MSQFLWQCQNYGWLIWRSFKTGELWTSQTRTLMTWWGIVCYNCRLHFFFALSILNSFRHTKYRENRVCAKKINKRMHWLQRKMKVNPNMYKNAPPLNTQQIWQTRNVEEFVEELQFFLSRDGLFLQIQNRNYLQFVVFLYLVHK